MCRRGGFYPHNKFKRYPFYVFLGITCVLISPFFLVVEGRARLIKRRNRRRDGRTEGTCNTSDPIHPQISPIPKSQPEPQSFPHPVPQQPASKPSRASCSSEKTKAKSSIRQPRAMLGAFRNKVRGQARKVQSFCTKRRDKLDEDEKAILHEL